MVNPLKKWVDSPKREQNRLSKLADKVDEYADDYAKLSNAELQGMTPKFKERYQKGETLDDLLPEAFAVVREGAKRVLGMFPFHVQVMGGIVLHEGNIAEMKTGEGKTLTATMPVYLNALAGKGVHVITVNEYLSQRDATEMGELYNWLGLSVAVNNSKMSEDEKRWAYQQDIVYSTNSEIGFDYLRDNMVVDEKDLVQRPLNFTLIDEVDSVLIDEARTPLIISGGAMDSNQLYVSVDRCVKQLKNEVDYKVDLESKTVSLTDDGIRKVEAYFGTDNLYAPDNVAITHHLDNALRANYIMLLDKDYVVRDGEVLIVDSFTGRVMDGRRFSDGLHQAIEAKEGVDIQEETKTLANITYQNLFRMYKKLAGMTGTAKTEEDEFREIYNMLVIPIPTNRPIARDDRPDVLYPTLHAKFKAVVAEIKELHEKGQPILIGTVAVETSEMLSNLLDNEGIPHEVLNAKNHAKEADIIMNAGQKGAVTIATNMAGRGTDIKLGPGVKELGGLAVIGTERHESRRIDNQLRGRSGRQGDPGMSQFYLSLEDDLMKRFGGDRISNFLERLQGEDEEAEDTVIRSRLLTKSVESSQKRVEGNNYDSRKQVLQYDDVLREQREIMYAQRRTVLTEKDSLKYVIMQMIRRTVDATVNLYMQGDKPAEWELDKLLDFCITNLYSPDEISLSDLEGRTPDEVKRMIMTHVDVVYNEKQQSLYSPDQMLLFDRAVILKVVDDHWTEHIDSMEQLRQSIQLRGYAQLNPLVEYQREGYNMFEDMIGNMDFDVTRLFMKSSARQALASVA